MPACLGLALARYGLEIVQRMMFLDLDLVGGPAPFWVEHGPQPSTMLYVLALVVITAAVAGILPALHATRRRGGADLRQPGGSTGPRLGRLWSALIVTQVAFAVAVLPAAIKMGLNGIRTSLTRPNYPVEEFAGAAIQTVSGSSSFGNRLPELRRRLEAEPAVTGVTFSGFLPERNVTGRIEVEGISPGDVEGAAWAGGCAMPARRTDHRHPGTRSLAWPKICGATRSTRTLSVQQRSIPSHPSNWRVRA